ncbi:hypothetical protein JAAARDRAFT_30128 [Jaapia argillacea MUCL 33604]|uniref:Uncharacterized protein n=1 Tax=Jaapia argillacea MUCL 33604 TaxID=933084 RepID=A0A067Q7U4_9AGAM|nr:hypothetical protein JAAARDRAFT_30128 [Jaapia argillacea MUCL 33604]
MAARPTHVASATITQPAAIASPTPNHPTVIVANVETPQTDLKLSRYLPCRPIVPITRSRPALPIHFRPHNVRPQDQLENKNLEKRLHEAEQTEAMMHMKARQRKTKLEASDAEVSEMRGRVEEGDHRVMVLESLICFVAMLTSPTSVVG